jgi:hypothetical protein
MAKGFMGLPCMFMMSRWTLIIFSRYSRIQGTQFLSRGGFTAKARLPRD